MDSDSAMQNQSSCGEEEEEQAESIDSGCVADSTSDSSLEWKQVSGILQNEYAFMMNLLQTYGISRKGNTSTSEAVGSLDKEPAEVDGKSESLSALTEGTSSVVGPSSECRISQAIKSEPTNSKKESVSETFMKVCASNKSNEEKLHVLQKLLSDLRKGKFNHKITKKEALVMQKKLKKKIFLLTKPRNKKMQNSEQQTAHNPQKRANDKLSSKPAIQIGNQGGKLVFNKFDFHLSQEEKVWSESKQKNLHNVLNKVLKEKEQVKKLAAEGKAQPASKIILDKGWENAMKKAQGIKVKDNPELLAKSLNKMKHRKQKSQRDWESREKSMQDNKQMRQQKREENINLKRQRKADAKSKKSKKKGRVPGF